MPDFLLRDLPEDLMEKLKARASRNGRSLQAEIRDTLEQSVPMSREEWFEAAAALRARCRPSKVSARELIEEGHRERDARIDAILRGEDPDESAP